MRVGDKIAPLHHPILKPANLPDFLAVARTPVPPKDRLARNPGGSCGSPAGIFFSLSDKSKRLSASALPAPKASRRLTDPERDKVPKPFLGQFDSQRIL
jgi:hypothetical protein